MNAFSKDYEMARRRFLAAAASRGARLASYRNPAAGPGGLELSTDVAAVGGADARHWLIGVSGTHGVEGFVGSAAQIAWLEGGAPPPAGVGVLLVHAINPFGFASLARVNEDNVDLNRNQIDHAAPLPRNAHYEALAADLVPDDWFGAGRLRADAAIAAFAERHGPRAIPEACSGQYHHPDGIFFGGTKPVWSNLVLKQAVQHFAAAARLVAYIDFHTGLGPYGVGEAICYHAPGEAAYDFAIAAYGSGITTPHLGTSASPLNKGKTGYGVQAALPQAVVSCITLEFGTYDHTTVFDSIRADAWARLHAAADSPEMQQVKADIRRAFYPDRDDWRIAVAGRSADIIEQATARLATA